MKSSQAFVLLDIIDLGLIYLSLDNELGLRVRAWAHRAQGMKFLSVDLKVYSELETNFQRHGSANFRLIQKRVNELLLLTSSSSASYKFDQRKIIPSEEPTKYCSFFKLATTSTWLFTL